MNKKIAAMALILGATLFTALPTAAATQPTIDQGIYIQGIDVGGMTRSEATEVVDAYFQNIAEQDFQLVCTDRELVTLSLSDWDFTWDTEEVVDKAFAYSRSGFLIRSYKNQQNLHYSNLYLDTAYSISTDAIEASLNELAETHDMPAVNPVVSHVGSSFRITTSGKGGKVTDLSASVHAIQDAISKRIYEKDTTTLRADVVGIIDMPDYTAQDISTIKDNLGTFTTDYSESSDNRKTNIAVAANYLNGTILLPGESCSTSTTIKDRTLENGYKIAAQYSNGEAEQDVGGGVCQVSTTLYNAILRAELQVDERHNHSMIVHYVDYGDDAAIATGSKDLVFTNNLDHPIFIEAIADGDYLTFTIYGTETRPSNRRVEYVAETIYTKWPADDDMHVKYSKDLAEGKTKITGTVRPEVSATLTKVVYVNDQETERTLLHTDFYQSSKKTITYGTKKKESQQQKQ